MAMQTSRADLESLVAHLPTALAKERVDAAIRDVEAFAEARRLVPVEGSRRAALRRVFPGRVGVGNLLARLKRFEKGGPVELLHDWLPPAPSKALTAEPEAAIGLLMKLNANASARELRQAIAKLGCDASESSIKRFRASQGLSRASDAGPRTPSLGARPRRAARNLPTIMRHGEDFFI